MATDEHRDDAAVFDFLDEFLRDIERGSRKPLTHYLERYKGHEEAVAIEYFAELERAGLGAAPKTNGAAAASASELEADPQRVGPYKLLRELGRGGQGAVWLAEDTRIARRVALKLLPAEFAALSTERRKRLQREAEVIARLDHPCLCAVLDARIDGERPYIAMRYVEGGTLGECIARAREARKAERGGQGTAARAPGPLKMAPRTALELAGVLMYFERAARALHAAHEAGVMHRDVKPQNLMVTRSGDPVVLDFGQARDESSDSFELTRSGDVMGTPAYMSPEQILGKREGVDRRTDVWSLGASLFEALTLTRAFEAESVPALFLAIRGLGVPDPRTLNSALPSDLSLVVATALEKEPERRYRTALDFAEDLRRVREYEPVRARPPSAWRVVRSWFQRHPTLAYSTLGSIVALSIGLASTLYLLGEYRTRLAYERGLLLGHRTDELISEDPSAALAWGIEAVRAAPEFQTRASLFRALQACHLRSMIDASPARRAPDCAVAPDGSSVAVALDDGGVRVCDLETGEIKVVVREGQANPKVPVEARDVDYSPDGSRLAFVTAERQAHVADPRTGQHLAEFGLLGGEARRIAFVAGGARLLGLSDEGLLCADAGSGKESWRWLCPEPPGPERETKLIVHPGASRALVWVSDPKRKLESSRAWLIDVQSGVALRALDAAGGIVSAEFREDGLGFATGSDDGTLRVWSASSGDLERSFERPDPAGTLRAVRYSPDGSRVLEIVETGKESRAWMRYLAHGALAPVGNPGGRVVHAAFSPDGQRLATIGSDMVVRLFGGTDNHEEQSFRGLFAPREISWTQDGRRLVTLGNGNWPCVSVWYAGALPDVFAMSSGNSPVCRARFSPDGERVLVASEDGMARVWAAPSNGSAAESSRAPSAGQLLFTMTHAKAVRDAVYSPDGARIATASDDGSAKLWNASDGTEPRIMIEGQAPLASVAFSYDGAFAAVRSSRGEVFLCETRGPHRRRILDTRSPVTAVAWVPHKTELVTGHAENALRRFDARDGSMIEEHAWEPFKAGQPVGSFAIAARADGKEIALACADGSACFFVPGVKEDEPKHISTITPQSIEFSLDGKRLLVTGRAGRGALRLQDLELARKFFDTGKRVVPVGETAGEIGLTPTHAGEVTGGAFSPDGNWVITTAKAGGAYVRDSKHGQLYAHFAGPAGRGCTEGSISPGTGTPRALVAFDDGSVWVWPLDPLSAALARKPRELTELEKKREENLGTPSQQRAGKPR